MRRRKRSTPLTSSSSSYPFYLPSLLVSDSLRDRTLWPSKSRRRKRGTFSFLPHNISSTVSASSASALSHVFFFTGLFGFFTLVSVGLLRLYDEGPAMVLFFSSTFLWNHQIMNTQDHTMIKKIVYPLAALPVQDIDIADDNDGFAKTMDFGDLKLRFLPQSHFRRCIPWNDQQLLAQYRQKGLDRMEQEIAEEYEETHSHDPSRQKLSRSSSCRPLAWTQDSFPTCNTVHEVATLDRVPRRDNREADSSSLYDIKQLGQGGYYRLGFLFDAQNVRDDFVLKVLHADQIMGKEQLSLVTTEALLLGYFTSSERFSNVYSHCGTSMLVERGQDLSHHIIPFLPGQDDEDMRGYISNQDLHQLELNTRDGMYQGNTMDRGQKLDVAIAITESVALLHGFWGGPVVQNDIAFVQWLYSMGGQDRRVMLNDLNSAVPLEWDAEEQTYCAFQSETGNFKAPEHFFFGETQTEKADIWPLGCILYGILTGLTPYHEYFEANDLPRLTIMGVPPVLPAQYRTREQEWVHLMDQMFVVDVAERIDIFQVLQQLYDMRRRHRERTLLTVI